jgi:hypothetical protein
MAELAVSLPESRPEDDEDVVWGLSTAIALWARGERGDAIVWIRRAADAAVAAGQPERGAELSSIAIQVEQALEAHIQQTMPPPSATPAPVEQAPVAAPPSEAPSPAAPVPDHEPPAAPPAPAPSTSTPELARPAAPPPTLTPPVSASVAPPPPPPRGPLPSYQFIPTPRVAPRAPILDPWAEEQTTPSMRVDPAVRGIQLEGDAVVVQMRRPSQVRMAAVTTDDDDVVTSAAPLDVTLRTSSRPPAPPPPRKPDPLPGQIADAAVPSKTASRPPPLSKPPSPPSTEPSRPASPPPAPSKAPASVFPPAPSKPASSVSPPASSVSPPSPEPSTEPLKPRRSPSPSEPSRPPATQRPGSIAPPRPASRPPAAMTVPLPPTFTASSPAAPAAPARSSPPPAPGATAAADAPTMPSAPSPLRARSIPPASLASSDQPSMPPVPTVPRVPTVPMPSRPAVPSPSSIRVPTPASVRPPPPAPVARASVRPPRPAPSAPLSLDGVAAFASLTPEARSRVASLARVEVLAADEEIAGFGAALLLDGSASLSATIVDASVAPAELRTLVTTRGSLSGGAALRVVAGAEGARVATWDAAAIDEALRASAPEVLEDLVRRADRLQALAGATMGPLQDLDDATRAAILAQFEVRVARPGEPIVEAGHKLAGLSVVCVGSVDLAGGAGVVRAGEMIYPRASHRDMPAPTAARAGLAGAILLVGDRAIAGRLASIPAIASEFAD